MDVVPGWALVPSRSKVENAAAAAVVAALVRETVLLRRPLPLVLPRRCAMVPVLWVGTRVWGEPAALCVLCVCPCPNMEC